VSKGQPRHSTPELLATEAAALHDALSRTSKLVAMPTTGSGELPVAAYELFGGADLLERLAADLLERLAMEKMLAGLSTRLYGVGLEPVAEEVGGTATSTGKSAVSRRYVARTERTKVRNDSTPMSSSTRRRLAL